MKALVVDVDGTVSPVHGSTAWGDDVEAGTLFGPVLVSPMLVRRLDDLARRPGVVGLWLSSWDEEMRGSMDPFPGRAWATVADQYTQIQGRDWWKLTALETWLAAHREIDAIAWCDDQLRGGRPAAVRRRCARLEVDVLMIAPRTARGLTPDHIARVEAWLGPSSQLGPGDTDATRKHQGD